MNGLHTRPEEKDESQMHKAQLRGEVVHPEEFRSGKATWRIFRVMAELVEGYDFLSKINADITVFGSARLKPGTPFYEEARQFAKLMAEKGYSIVTGGGPGIMEAANRGATEGKGESIGLNIELPFEQRINKYVRHGLGFNFFFTRKVMLTSPAQAFVAFPGGFGTLDEIFEVLTLIQTAKMQPVPVVLVCGEFWNPLDKFIRESMLQGHQTISEKDTKLYVIVNTAEEAAAYLEEHCVAPDSQNNHDHSED